MISKKKACVQSCQRDLYNQAVLLLNCDVHDYFFKYQTSVADAEFNCLVVKIGFYLC